MESITIHRIKLNKEYSLTRKQDEVILCNEGLTVSIDTLSRIRKLSNLDKIKNILEYYPGLSPLNITGSQEYSKILGKKKSNEYRNYIVKEINHTTPMITSYHTRIFPDRKKCYNNLAQVFLENNALELPIYDHSGVTGRTSIKKGFNFLTMKKSDRVKLTHPTKKLVEVDFKSCEPFFFLKSQGVEIKSDDVYSWLMEKYNIHNVTRDKFKRGILSIIYGANTKTTSRIMQVPHKKVVSVKEDLGINDLEKKLRSEYDENGFILNYYGRPITSDSNLVNYWIQSSTVDFCSLAFKSFCDKNNLQPCFFVHDSMTFCVDSESITTITAMSEIKEYVSEISVPVKFTVFS